jgi:hypothetical protein
VACPSFIQGLFFDVGVEKYLALCLRHVLKVSVNAVVKPVEVVPGATDGGAGASYLASSSFRANKSVR